MVGTTRPADDATEGAAPTPQPTREAIPVFRPFSEEFDWDGFQHLARNAQFLNNSLNRLANTYFDATENGG